MRRVVLVGVVAILSVSMLAAAISQEELNNVLQPLIRPGVSVQLAKECDSEYTPNEPYSPLLVEVERKSYVMVFLVEPDGRIMRDLPSRGFTVPRPPALLPGEIYELPTDWFEEPCPTCQLVVSDKPGPAAVLVIASEVRIGVPTYKITRQGFVTHYIDAPNLAGEVELILDALRGAQYRDEHGVLQEAWWAAAVCFLAVVSSW